MPKFEPPKSILKIKADISSSSSSNLDIRTDAVKTKIVYNPEGRYKKLEFKDGMKINSFFKVFDVNHQNKFFNFL